MSAFSSATSRRVCRVFMTVDAVGGVWTYAAELAKAYSHSGVAVLLACLGPAPTRSQLAEIDRPGVSLLQRDFALEWMPDPWDQVDASGEWLLECAREFDPDLIHLNGYTHAVLPWEKPVLLVAHSCVATWWRAVKGEPLPDDYAEYRARVGAGMRTADLIVAPTAAMLDALYGEYGRIGAARVIQNGRTPNRECATAKRSIIFSAGRLWDEAKNIQLLFRIAPDLEWPLRIAGEDRAMSLSRESDVCALGRLSAREMASELGQASIYAAPALYEPFGLGILEAAQAGCALVLGDIGSLRELWGDAALFLPPNNPREWTAALNVLASNRAELSRLSLAARERASRYTAAAMTSAYLRTYRDLIGSSQSEMANA